MGRLSKLQALQDAEASDPVDGRDGVPPIAAPTGTAGTAGHQGLGDRWAAGQQPPGGQGIQLETIAPPGLQGIDPLADGPAAMGVFDPSSADLRGLFAGQHLDLDRIATEPAEPDILGNGRLDMNALTRTPRDVADRLAPADPETFVCLTCRHYVEVGHYDATAAPEPWTSIMRFCQRVHYEQGDFELTDEAISYCNRYRPLLLELLRGRGIRVWLRNHRLLRASRDEMERRGRG